MEDGEFYFPSPTNFNDPFDCTIEPVFPESDEEFFCDWSEGYAARNPGVSLEELRRDFKNGKCSASQIQEFMLSQYHTAVDNSGVLSFGADPSHILMWSHYSDSHTGICIGVSTKRLQEQLQDPSGDLHISCGRVTYEEKCPNSPFSDRDDFHAFLEMNFLTKSAVWKYENEIRALMFKRDGSNLRDEDRLQRLRDVVVEVIIGLKVSEDHKREIETISRERGYYVRQASKKPHSFEISMSPSDF